MEWKLPPQSECGEYKLVSTYNEDDEIFLIIIGDKNGAIKRSLNDLQDHTCEKLRGYITSLLSGIQSGLYDPSSD